MGYGVRGRTGVGSSCKAVMQCKMYGSTIGPYLPSSWLNTNGAQAGRGVRKAGHRSFSPYNRGDQSQMGHRGASSTLATISAQSSAHIWCSWGPSRAHKRVGGSAVKWSWIRGSIFSSHAGRCHCNLVNTKLCTQIALRDHKIN